MVRMLGILVVGLIALNIGLGVALFKTRADARSEILVLRDEIQSRTTFGPRGGREDGGRDGNRGGNNFKEVQKRLNLSEEQTMAFKAFLQARREVRRAMAKELSGSQLAFEKALTADSFDKAKLKALRDGFSEKRFKANEEAFVQFEAFLETLNLEQRKQMFELGKRSPNALLFL